LGLVLGNLGRFDEAEREMQEAYGKLVAALGEDRYRAATARDLMAEVARNRQEGRADQGGR
jgi:hypothetical protein